MVKSKIAITRELKKTADVNFFDADMKVMKSEIQVRYDRNKVISLSRKDIAQLLKDSKEKELKREKEIFIYAMGDSEWWISDKDEEDTLAAYCEEYGMKIDEDIGLENVNKCDLEKDGMYWCYEGQNDALHNLIKALLNGEKEKVISTEKGDFELKMCDGPCIWIPFRQAIKEFGKYKKPCMIACSEY